MFSSRWRKRIALREIVVRSLRAPSCPYGDRTRQAASMFEAIVLVPALASEWTSRSRGSRRWRLGAARACELCAGCCWALLKLKRSLTNYRIILCRGSGPQAGWVGRCVCVGSGGGEGGGSVIN